MVVEQKAQGARTRVFQEEYQLTQAEVGMVGVNIAVPVAEPNAPLFSYQIPLGLSYIFRPSDIFSAYLFTGLSPSIASSKGTALTDSPVTLALGANTLTVAATGTINVNMGKGLTGVAASGTGTIASSPVTLAEGNNEINFTVAGNCTVTLTAIEANTGSRIELAVTDPAKQNKRSLLNQLRYTEVKEFQDQEKKCHLSVPKGRVIIANEGEWLQILANLLGATAAYASCYFVLSCLRIRRTIF